jgi:hypothetical protein
MGVKLELNLERGVGLNSEDVQFHF